ncbi:MAG TPA: hypothetical protein VN788_11915 [Verrucomicrobiae bacterium]|nr:hypothetical protein [Verrucomicrobiae bacterium]
MYLLDIEALDLGPEVRAVSLDLVEADENREPVRGEDAAKIWSRVIRATAGSERWALDFFSHLDRVRDFCDGHGIEYREPNKRSVVIPAPEGDSLEGLIGRFQGETFGVRAGGALAGDGKDPALEGDLARRGADAYHHAFPNYYFCAICGFEDGSLVVLSEKLWASEIIRRARPAVRDLKVEIRLPV